MINTYTYKLAAHPTPAADTYDFGFSSKEEFTRYRRFETNYCTREISALGAALTPAGRDKAKTALAKMRIIAYSLWKTKNQIDTGSAA